MSIAEFYALVAGLLTLLIMLVVLPLWLGRSQQQRDQVTNAHLVKARLEEMQREVDEGVLARDDLAVAQDEVKLALLDEQLTAQKQQTMLLPALLVGLCLAIGGGVVVYTQVNHLDGVAEVSNAPLNLKTLSEKLLDPAQAEDISPQDIQSLALAIRLKLKEQPDDAQGWMFLGRLRMTLGQLEESIAAYERSLLLRPDNTMTRVSFAQALMMSNTDEGLKRAQRVLVSLIEQSPTNDNLNLMMAVASAQLGQNEVAMPYYQSVRAKLEPNNPMRLSLDEQLGLVAVDVEDTGSLTVSIEVAPELADKIDENANLLVFVRPDDTENGIPIAVKRTQVRDFPLTLTLGDGDAMMPGTVLSDFSAVNVTVRLSKTMDVSAAAGDLQGHIFIPDRNAAESFSVIVNKEL